jgi:tellurite resistance protein TehA-like permease
VPLALAILAILFLRLATAKLPGKELAVSGWLTIGPLGTGSLAATLLGRAGEAHGFLPVGLVIGLVLWAYGAWWWIIGIFGTLYHARRTLPFNMGWWGFTFPLGVYTAATYVLASVMNCTAFLVIAAMLTILLIALWLTVLLYTARGVYTGIIFQNSPSKPAPAPLSDRAAA